MLRPKPLLHKKPRTDAELLKAAKIAKLKREGKLRVNLKASKTAKMAAKKMSKADRSKRAKLAAKTRKSRQHLINAKIAKAAKFRHK